MQFLLGYGILVVPVLLVAVVIGFMTRHVLLPIAFAAIAAIGIYAVAWLQLGEHQTWHNATALSGNRVQVEYAGGECEGQRTVKVRENEGSVTITITTRTYASACSDIGVDYKVTVELDEPLGDRKLIDGSR